MNKPMSWMAQEGSPPDDPLAVFLVGLGAVGTTFLAGCELARRGLAAPVGSLALTQRIRCGPKSDRNEPLICELLPLAQLRHLRFMAWDPIGANAFEAAAEARVLSPEHRLVVREFLEGIVPCPATFNPKFVKNLAPSLTTNVATYETGRHAVLRIREQMRGFFSRAGACRGVMLWCGSTESMEAAHPGLAAMTPEELDRLLDDPEAKDFIPPSVLYAIAALLERVPFANATPNLGANAAAVERLATWYCVPVAGRDLKTGQTMMKTVLAPALKVRSLGLRGWFSTNILGNRDGLVLDDAGSFRAKEATKSEQLKSILDAEAYPELYGNITHKVRIEYYPPRGDEKEGWDNLDIFGWLGYPMQIKVNFLCRDSILAAPLVLDLLLFLDLAQRAGLSGVQDWLSFYFKAPAGRDPEHDLFLQHFKLKNRLRQLAGVEPLTHAEEEG